MKLTLRDELPFVSARVACGAKQIEIPNVLVDTGSASTVLSADVLANVGIIPEFDDVLHVVHGVGGSELVFSRHIDYLQVGEKRVAGFEIEVGGMDYGFDIDGILGMDFMTCTRATIDLGKLEILFSDGGWPP